MVHDLAKKMMLSLARLYRTEYCTVSPARAGALTAVGESPRRRALRVCTRGFTPFTPGAPEGFGSNGLPHLERVLA